MLSILRTPAEPQTTKALKISLKSTQNLYSLCVMCAWAVQDGPSHLSNLQAASAHYASSPLCFQSQKPMRAQQRYFQTGHLMLRKVAWWGQHRSTQARHRNCSPVTDNLAPVQVYQLEFLNYAHNSRRIAVELKKNCEFNPN